MAVFGDFPLQCVRKGRHDGRFAGGTFRQAVRDGGAVFPRKAERFIPRSRRVQQISGQHGIEHRAGNLFARPVHSGVQRFNVVRIFADRSVREDGLNGFRIRHGADGVSDPNVKGADGPGLRLRGKIGAPGFFQLFQECGSVRGFGESDGRTFFRLFRLRGVRCTEAEFFNEGEKFELCHQAGGRRRITPMGDIIFQICVNRRIGADRAKAAAQIGAFLPGSKFLAEVFADLN